MDFVEMASLMSSYGRQPVEMNRGQGAALWDSEGREYLDALSGIAVCSLGHANPAVTRAIADQAATLVHCSNVYHIDRQEQLGERLCAIAGMDKVFFCNSGAEANEAGIKIARLHAHQRGISTPRIIVTDTAFHGRTMATLSATGNTKIQAGFGPLLPGFEVVPYNDLVAIEALADAHDDIVAVLVEPIQGEGGINIPDDHYLASLRALCDQHQWLLMVDEIQSGMGRTGHWFAHQANGITPDVMMLAKALGNGVPIGATLAYGAAADLIQPGSHGSTFGGNPLACSAALAVIQEIEDRHLLARAAALGERFLSGFQRRLHNQPGVVDIRGRGLMIGVELDTDCAALVGQALERGLLINVTAGNVIRLLPPMILSDEQVDQAVDIVSDLVVAFLNKNPDSDPVASTARA